MLETEDSDARRLGLKKDVGLGSVATSFSIDILGTITSSPYILVYLFVIKYLTSTSEMLFAQQVIAF